MIKTVKVISAAMLTAASAYAYSYENHHLHPNITDYELPYLTYRKAYSAEISGLKGQREAGGSDEALRATIDLVGVGLKKERVDNRYSYIDVSYGRSSGGELDYTNSEIEIQNLYSFRYGEGRHIGRSGSMDWNIYVAAESVDLQLGFETKTAINLGLGGEVAYSITSFFDIKGILHVSNSYRGAFVGFDVNF